MNYNAVLVLCQHAENDEVVFTILDTAVKAHLVTEADAKEIGRLVGIDWNKTIYA